MHKLDKNDSSPYISLSLWVFEIQWYFVDLCSKFNKLFALKLRLY